MAAERGVALFAGRGWGGRAVVVVGVLALWVVGVVLVVTEVLVLVVQVIVAIVALLARYEVYGQAVRADVLHLTNGLGGGGHLQGR